MYPAFYFDAERPIDLICMGRVAVDLYSEQIGTALRDAESFKNIWAVVLEILLWVGLVLALNA